MAIKLIFFDMEGTLLVSQRRVVGPDHAHHTSMWTRIFGELGADAQRDNIAMIERWDGGGYRSFMDWVDDSLLAMQRHGLTRTHFEAIVADATYNDGVAETVAALHGRGVRSAIVTGGFVAQARRAQVALRIHHAYAATDLYWDDDGNLVHWNIYPSDFEGKVDFVNLLIREYGFSTDECAFVGDGANDVAIASAVGVSFAYNAHEDLRRVASHAITDFRQILTLLA